MIWGRGWRKFLKLNFFSPDPLPWKYFFFKKASQKLFFLEEAFSIFFFFLSCVDVILFFLRDGWSEFLFLESGVQNFVFLEKGLRNFFFSISSGPPPRSLMVVPLLYCQMPGQWQLAWSVSGQVNNPHEPIVLQKQGCDKNFEKLLKFWQRPARLDCNNIYGGWPYYSYLLLNRVGRYPDIKVKHVF